MKTHDNDVAWVLYELKELHNSLQIIYRSDESTLDYITFKKIDELLNEVTNKVEYAISGKKVIAVHDKNKPVDLVIGGNTPIFEQYRTSLLSFSEYFNTCLNPDFAPPGFLEQLSKLLMIAGERPLLVHFSIYDKEELDYFKVIKEYIESQRF